MSNARQNHGAGVVIAIPLAIALWGAIVVLWFML